MIIHELELENFCQHRHRHLAFSAGLNLLVGPNGSGKSNILRALQFALTGDAGGDRNKLDDISQGCGANEHAGVMMLLSHGDARMRITRNLRPNSTKLYLGNVDGAYKTGATETNAELWARLGATKKQIIDYVFVGQRKVDEMFDQKPADRAASLAALFGLQHAAAVWKQAGEFISSIEVPATLLDEDALLRRLDSLNTEALANDLATLREAAKADAPKVQAAKARLQQWQTYHASEQARDLAEKARREFAAKPMPTDNAPPLVPELSEDEMETLAALTRNCNTMRQSIAMLEARGGKCISCGQQLPGAISRATRLRELEAACATAEAERDALEARERAWQAYDRCETAMNNWVCERERVFATLDALKACDRPAASEDSLRKILRDYSELQADINVLAAQLERAQSERQNVERQLAEFRQIRTRTTRTREAITELTETRQVFHHDEAPRIMSYTYVENMLEEVNETLEIFDAPYRVVMDENLGFIANFLDSVRCQPDKRLSVGERIVLAMAFRITVNSTFAGQVGMLVMDEPTAGLDEHNLGCLPRALARLKELSDERGLQVFFVTHEPRITTIFDNVIELPAATL